MSALERFAPLPLQEDWDNAGLQLGLTETEASGALLCLDVNERIVDEAIAKGCNLIVSHHPLLFRGAKALRADTYEGALLARLIRADVALVAAHTNLDRAPGGVNDCLAAALGLRVRQSGDYLRVGEVQARSAGELLAWVRQRINPQAVFYGDAARRIDCVACASGAGGEFAAEAARLGAQVFVTGEMKHNERIEAEGLGLCVLLAGHGESEAVVLEPLRAHLQASVRVETFQA